MASKPPVTIKLGGLRRRGPLAAILVLLSILGPAAHVASAGSTSVTIGTPQPFSETIYPTSIACVDADTCYVAGTAQRFSGPGVLLTLTDGTVSNEQTLPAASSLQSLACSSGGACYAIGADAERPSRALVFTIENGAAGQPKTIDGIYLDGVACSDNDMCYAVADQSSPPYAGPFVVPIIDGVAGALEPVPDSNLLYDIDCPTADTCYAVGGPVAVVVPIVDGQPGTAQPIPGGYFHAIACPSPDICYAVGYAGGEASANEGQGTGGIVQIVDGQPGPVQTVAAAGPLGAIACPSADTCFADGPVHNPLSAGATQAQGFPPRPWAIVPIVGGTAGDLITPDAGSAAANATPLSGDCPTSDTCYLLTQAGIIPIAIDGR